MRDVIKQLWLLVRHTDKAWLVPLVLMLVIVSLLVISAQLSPVPVFMYPLV